MPVMWSAPRLLLPKGDDYEQAHCPCCNRLRYRRRDGCASNCANPAGVRGRLPRLLMKANMRRVFLAFGLALVLAAGGGAAVIIPSQPAMAGCGSGAC
jgi:hypothetical protein